MGYSVYEREGYSLKIWFILIKLHVLVFLVPEQLEANYYIKLVYEKTLKTT